MSAVTVTECLVRPFRAGPEAATLVSTFLAHFPNLRVRAVDFEVAAEAAVIARDRDVDALYVKTLLVDQGPKMRRFMARAMGRATKVEKKTSHVFVELGIAARGQA